MTDELLRTSSEEGYLLSSTVRSVDFHVLHNGEEGFCSSDKRNSLGSCPLARGPSRYRVHYARSWKICPEHRRISVQL